MPQLSIYLLINLLLTFIFILLSASMALVLPNRICTGKLNLLQTVRAYSSLKFIRQRYAARYFVEAVINLLAFTASPKDTFHGRAKPGKTARHQGLHGPTLRQALESDACCNLDIRNVLHR